MGKGQSPNNVPPIPIAAAVVEVNSSPYEGPLSPSSKAALERRGTHRLLNLGNGAAPLTFVGDLDHLQHSSDCPYQLLMVSARSETHSVRAFCSCMSRFVKDKQFALEVQSRDLTIDAFALVLTMVKLYGSERVIGDNDLVEIVARYDFVSKLYKEIKATLADHPHHFNLPLLSDLTIVNIKAPDLPVATAIGGFPFPPGRPKPTAAQVKGSGSSSSRHSLSDVLKRRGTVNYLEAWSGPWKTMVDEKACKVMMRTCPHDKNKASFRLDGVLETTLAGMLSVVNEVEMADKWAPYYKFPMRVGLKRAHCLQRFARMDKASLYEIDLPWPLKNRDASVQGYMIDDLERNGRIAFCIQSLDLDFPRLPCLNPMEIPPVAANTIRITLEGGCLISAPTADTVYMENLWNIDLKESVPSTLLNFVGGTFIKAAYQSFRKFSRKVAEGSEWQAARSRDPWLYNFVQNRVGELKAAGIDIGKVVDKKITPSVDTEQFLKYLREFQATEVSGGVEYSSTSRQNSDAQKGTNNNLPKKRSRDKFRRSFV